MKYSYEKSVSKYGTLVFHFGEGMEALTDFLIMDVDSERDAEEYVNLVELAMNDGKQRKVTGNTTTVTINRETVHLQNEFYEATGEIETEEFVNILKEYVKELKKVK